MLTQEDCNILVDVYKEICEKKRSIPEVEEIVAFFYEKQIYFGEIEIFDFFGKNRMEIMYLGRICFSAQSELFPELNGSNYLPVPVLGE